MLGLMSLIGLLSVLQVHSISALTIGEHCQALNGSTLRIVGVGMDPYLNFEQLMWNGLPSGVDAEILYILAHKLSFSVSMSSTRIYGILLPNATWLGAVGRVTAAVADVGIGQISYNVERYQAVTYTVPTNVATHSYLTRKPSPLTQHFKVVQVFPLAIWTLILLALISMIAVAYIATLIHCGESSLLQLTFDILGLMVAKRAEKFVRLKLSSSECEIVTLVFIWYSSIVIHAYSSTLLGRLMTTIFEKPITNTVDLINANRHLYLLYGSNQHFSYSQSHIASHQMLFQECVDNNRFYHLENRGKSNHISNFHIHFMLNRLLLNLYYLYEGVPDSINELIIEEGAAIIMDQSEAREHIADVLQQQGVNPFRIAEEQVDFLIRGFVMQKNSCLKHCFDPLIGRLIDSGVIPKIFESNASPIRDGGNDKKRRETPINLEQLYFAGMFYLTGITIAVAIFVCELKVENNINEIQGGNL